MVLKLSVELCQLMTEPVNPVSVNVPEFAPEHCTALGPETFPPMETPFTETVNTPEVVAGHTPFWITAWKLVVVARLLKAWVKAVLEMVCVEAKLLVELSQLRMLPLYPASVRVPAFAPAQMGEIGPEIFPPMETPFTETVNTPEVVAGQMPFWITAWKLVVVVRLLKAWVKAVFEIVCVVAKLLVELSQLRILPL